MLDFANRMGLLIIQDMPSMYYEHDLPGRLHPEVTLGEKKQFESEFKRMIEVSMLWYGVRYNSSACSQRVTRIA